MKAIVILFILAINLVAFEPTNKLPSAIDIDDIEQIHHIERFCLSEKLDGQRGRWDGKRLLSRSGHIILAPDEFIAQLPPTPLDGELYCDEGFEQTLRSIRGDFKCVKLHVFDAPAASGGLLERLKSVHENDRVKLIPQIQISSYEQVRKLFAEFTNQGAEGVVLHDCSLPYERSYARENFYKIKRYYTGICTIIGQNEGTDGLVGSYNCGWDGGEYGKIIAPAQVLKIGSGLSQNQRVKPLDIGTNIQFKFYRLTAKGKPRHAVFLRVDKE